MFMYCNPDTIYFKFHNVPDWNVIRNMIDVSWGTIVGNLEDQKDLKDYINNAVTGDIDLSDYVTKELLESKHYLTEHQSLADYATKLYVDDKVKSIKIPDINPSNYYTKLEVDKKIEGLSTGDIDLSEYAKKTELPTKLSELVNDSGYITTYTETDPVWNSEKSNYYTKDEINNKNYLTEHQSLAAYAKKTELPKKLSELTNDSGYITTYTETDPVWNSEKSNYYTKTEINNKNYLTEHQSLAAYAKKTELPKKLSELTNDSGYITTYTETDPVWNSEKSNYYTKTEINNKNYLTEHQSLADYVKTEALTTALTTYAKKTDIPSVPTKLSELTNDSGYITTYTETDPVWNSEKVNYYTKTEINNKNYLTEHQSLADYAKKSEIPTDYVRNTELTSYATKTYVTEQIGSINSVLENI